MTIIYRDEIGYCLSKNRKQWRLIIEISSIIKIKVGLEVPLAKGAGR